MFFENVLIYIERVMTRSVMQLICDIYNLIFMCAINFGRGVLFIISIEHYLFNQRTEPSQVNLTIVYVQKQGEASKGDDKKVPEICHHTTINFAF